MALNPVHFAKLQCSVEPRAWPGEKLSDWADAIAPGLSKKFALPDKHVSRDELIKICKSSSAERCFLAVMAWGAMKPHHGKSSWQNRQTGLLDAIEFVQLGRHLTRSVAYDRFHKAKRHGLGPAYFTKLIYFLRPQLGGYIMDQWTAKSINMLFGPTVLLSQPDPRGAAVVTERNGAAQYEMFCKRIDELAKKLIYSGSKAEEKLFSLGSIRRQPRGEWRQYVVDNWSSG